MTQSLRINKKEYMPSSVLSDEYGYSSDYISRLAREEKILATQVGRQWFVEPESLKTFVLKSEVEKKIRKEELSKSRKIERAKTSSVSTSTVHNKVFDFDTLAQVGFVLICSFLVGGLSWFSIEANLKFENFVQGSQVALSLLSKTVDSNSFSYTLNFNSKNEESHTLAASSSNVQYQPVLTQSSNEVYTQLPTFPERETPAPAHILMEEQFSDEVLVIEGGDETVTISPVFRNSIGEEHTFRLIPISE